MTDTRPLLIGTALVGVIVVVAGILMTDGPWTLAMVVPVAVLGAGMFWSNLAAHNAVDRDHTGPVDEPPLPPPPVGASATAPHTEPTPTRTVENPLVGANGDVTTVEAAAAGAVIAAPASVQDPTALIDRDTPARRFEFAASELSGDPYRHQCPRCGRFDGTVVDHAAGSISCGSCNAVFGIPSPAVAFVRTFDLGMLVADDPLSTTPARGARSDTPAGTTDL